jgi:hypothetical protein
MFVIYLQMNFIQSLIFISFFKENLALDVKGNFVVTNEDLLTYLSSNLSQWSRWFLDQSQIYYGDIVLHREGGQPTFVTTREEL